ncbi:MAG: DCC1-like thiol-disulfide oxidoreductase family protein [Cyanobacteriota bacterium]|nr:DCC1-like thiol-disulfide oxidoreductase family protein [Cyanobacteriota bacterium]
MTSHFREQGVAAAQRLIRADSAPAAGVAAPPTLVFDGGCPFCRHFAELSELRSGIPGLRIRDGRAETALRHLLAQRGFHLRDGAMVIDGERVWHGAEAIAWLCARMTPSAALLQVLAPWVADGRRARGMYPLLLLARRLALSWRGLPVDPDGCDRSLAPAGRPPHTRLPPERSQRRKP